MGSLRGSKKKPMESTASSSLTAMDPPDADRAIDLAAVGDMLPMGVSPEVSASIGLPVTGADLIVANLECPLTSAAVPRADKKYIFKAEPSSAALFDRRFVLSLANNHIMDYGVEGLKDTLEALTHRGVAHAGAGMNLEEAARPARVSVHGVSVAVLCAADRRYSSATPTTPGVCPADPELLRSSVQAASGDAALVAVSLHMGVEFTAYPSRAMLCLARVCIDAGARLVLFHHAHRLSGASLRGASAVLWGLGNYLFTPDNEWEAREGSSSVVWRFRYDPAAGLFQATEAVPLNLDRRGLPRILSDPQASRLLGRIERLSRRIDQARFLPLWRTLNIMDPAFLRAALPNYFDMARRSGLRETVSAMADSLSAHGGTRKGRADARP